MICEDALPVEFPGYPTIAVTGKLFNDGFDAAGKLCLVEWLFLRLVVIGAVRQVHQLAPPLDVLDEVPVGGYELPLFFTGDRLLCTAFFKNSFSRVSLPTSCSNCRTRSSSAAA